MSASRFMAYGENAMRLISYDDLRPKGIPYSKVQIWRLERDGHFPKRVQIGAQRYGWVEAEIEQWIAARIRARDEAAA
jgi:prophage regulatory protein